MEHHSKGTTLVYTSTREGEWFRVTFASYKPALTVMILFGCQKKKKKNIYYKQECVGVEGCNNTFFLVIIDT